MAELKFEVDVIGRAMLEDERDEWERLALRAERALAEALDSRAAAEVARDEWRSRAEVLHARLEANEDFMFAKLNDCNLHHIFSPEYEAELGRGAVVPPGVVRDLEARGILPKPLTVWDDRTERSRYGRDIERGG